MWVFRTCPHCGFPGADTRTVEQIVEDTKYEHDHVWGWDHEYEPDESGECVVCRD